MYEKPELTRVGEAEEVILGVVSEGYDIDLNYMDIQGEFETETLPE